MNIYEALLQESNRINEDASNPAFIPREQPPAKTVKAYKLFSGKSGRVRPLYVGANQDIPVGVWLDATEGTEGKPSKTGRKRVKSKLGGLSYRPGWHAGDLPIAGHIGTKDKAGAMQRRSNEVWAEVLLSADKDYQSEAGPNGLPYLPEDGYYRFKTNSNMEGDWMIAGSMKIIKILSENEVNQILEAAGVAPMAWEQGRLDLKSLGFDQDN